MAVNKFGFPLSSCYRCGGSGNYGPVQVQAGKCFACGGSGFVVRAGKARKAWVAFVAAWRKSSTILAGNVQGPMVLWSGEGRPVPYPASCRPQAWSAASVFLLLQSILGQESRERWAEICQH